MNDFFQQNKDEGITVHRDVAVAGEEKEVVGEEVKKVCWTQISNAVKCNADMFESS